MRTGTWVMMVCSACMACFGTQAPASGPVATTTIPPGPESAPAIDAGTQATSDPLAAAETPSCPQGSKWKATKCEPEVAYCGSPQPAQPTPASAPVAVIPIAGGTFLMGSNDYDSSGDERPVHPVVVRRFEIDATEVTVAAYRTCVDAGACSVPTPCSPPAPGRERGEVGPMAMSFCNWGRSDRNDHPVNCVDYEQASAYCRWAGKRLPTEQEWEYAAKGKDGRRFPWGKDRDDVESCSGRAQGTCPVGMNPKADSPFGVHDMGGNVSEWTSSWFSASYGKKPVETYRVHRGGTWFDQRDTYLRTTFRNKTLPSERSNDTGFRCVR